MKICALIEVFEGAESESGINFTKYRIRFPEFPKFPDLDRIRDPKKKIFSGIDFSGQKDQSDKNPEKSGFRIRSNSGKTGSDHKSGNLTSDSDSAPRKTPEAKFSGLVV